MKHTPGPWFLKGSYVRAAIPGALMGDGPKDFNIAIVYEGYEGDRAANARLVAAAPDLLAALEGLLYLLPREIVSLRDPRHEPLTNCLNASRAAIAKAKS